jgi:hypothetical protein
MVDRLPSTRWGRPRRRLAAAIATTAGVLALAAGCASPAPSETPAPVAATRSATRDGIVLRLTVENASPGSGQATRAIVTVDNHDPVGRAWQGGGCDFVASVVIETAAEVVPPMGRRRDGIAGAFKGLLIGGAPPASRLGSFIDDRFADGRVACPADPRTNTLASGGHLEMHATWTGEGNGAAASPGPATVVASFPDQGPAVGIVAPDAAVDRLAVRIPVQVVDRGIRLLSPGQAVDAALDSPAFAQWVAAAGPMQAWDGVDIETPPGAYIVVLAVPAQQGRATVDRVSGAVAFERRPRP